MPTFSSKSALALSTCHLDLRYLFSEIIKVRDCSVIYGYRGKEEQDELFRTGKSKLQWPNSRHNSTPSEAVDVIPYPIKQEDWDNRLFWIEWSSWVKGFAYALKVDITSGYDWDRDNNYAPSEQTFWDGPHFELTKK